MPRPSGTPHDLSAGLRFARADFHCSSTHASIGSYGDAITAMACAEFRMARDTEFVNPIHRFGTTTRIETGVIRDTSRMAIEIEPLILLPTMDPERFERCSFSLQDAVSLLTITMTELPPFIIHFDKLRWHRVTPFAQCTPVLTQGCQMAVAEVVGSPALAHYVKRENVPAEQTRSLHHYRIYLGAGGCHEAFAKSVYASGPGKISRVYAKLASGVRQRLKARG